MGRFFTIALGAAWLASLAVTLPARAQQREDETPPARQRAPDVEASDPRRPHERAASGTRARGGRERVLVDRPDRKRPKNALFVDLLGRPLTIGGRITQRTSYSANEPQEFDDFIQRDTSTLEGVDLDGDNRELEEAAFGKVEEDDQLQLRQELEVDLSYPVSERIFFYAALKANYSAVVSSDHGRRVPVFGAPAPAGPGTSFADDEFSDRLALSRDEFWLFYGNLFDSPFSLQLGRQRFSEDREWWWDRDFDAVRLRFDEALVHAEIGVGEDLLPVTVDEHGHEVIKPEEQDILRVFGHASWEWAPRNTLGLFALYQYDHSSDLPVANCNRDLFRPSPFGVPISPGDNIDDRLQTFLGSPPIFQDGCISDEDADESDANLTWFGLGVDGRRKLGRAGTLYYWGQLAGVAGNEKFYNFDSRGFTAGSVLQPKGVRPYQRRVARVFENRVLGFGSDLGLTLETHLPGQPRFTVGYAYGSGEPASSNETDQGFRQTGLQDNNDKFRGVNSFRYYGELLDPELANLHIATVALGFPVPGLRNSSLELVYHYYRQAEVTDYFRDVSFGRDPNSDAFDFGMDPDIGQEWDVILGIEEWERWEIELIGAAFQLGDAFRPREDKFTYLGQLQLRFNF